MFALAAQVGGYRVSSRGHCQLPKVTRERRFVAPHDVGAADRSGGRAGGGAQIIGLWVFLGFLTRSTTPVGLAELCRPVEHCVAEPAARRRIQ
jgi:hypothetical protein